MILGQCEERRLTGAFKSHPSLPSPQAQKLIPRLQLPRSCLPLAYLDPLAGQNALPGSNLFSAHIQILERYVDEDRWSTPPTVLIAQSAADDGLFAVERVREGIYAMCRLGTWVTVNMLERLQIAPMDVVRPLKRQVPEQPRLWGDNWWSTATVDFGSEGRYGLSSDLSFEKTQGVRMSLQMPHQKSTTPVQTTLEIPSAVLQGQINNALYNMEKEVVQDPEEVLNMVRAQYQDFLYTSKVSLLSLEVLFSLLMAI